MPQKTPSLWVWLQLLHNIDYKSNTCKVLPGEIKFAPDMLVHVNIAKQNNERLIHIKHNQRLWTLKALKTLPVLGLVFN